MQTVDAHVSIANQTVGLQEYGITNASLVAGLEARGATVEAIRVYGWEFPQDTDPLEQKVWEIEGVEYVYSMSLPGRSIVTVRFYVGEDREDSLVKIYNKIESNRDLVPPAVTSWVVKPLEVDDVPIVTGTLWSEDPNVGAYELRRVAHTIETELQRVPGTRDIDTSGGPDRVVSVRLDPEKLAGYGIDLQQLRGALASANASADAGSFASGNEDILVQAGTFLSAPEEIASRIQTTLRAKGQLQGPAR